jgi:hypothetical protein
MVLASWKVTRSSSHVAIPVRTISSHTIEQSAKTHARRNLAKRKETREKAWQRDGWAETVSKVTNHIHYLLQSLLMLHPTDLTTREPHGLIHTCTTIVQSSQVNEYCVSITIIFGTLHKLK